MKKTWETNIVVLEFTLLLFIFEVSHEVHKEL